ncbi:MAG: DUF2079 domain-containing protein [Symploca sp. SIO3E6]|nr:DUF2079 domain-containing protein [Caldora sp. SIO3E6]
MRKSLRIDITKSALAAAVIFFVLTSGLMLHRFYSFYHSYSSFDQGIFNQVFWNGIHGRFFESSLSSYLSSAVLHDGNLPTVSYHRLGQHFTPALLLWLPIYALSPSSPTLLVLQAALMTAAGLVLYALARVYLNPQLSTMITVSFYAANVVIGPTLANFHDSCQLPLYMFGLLLALEKRWWWLFAGLAVLLLGVREDSGILLFSVGFYLVLSRRYPSIGLILCTLSFGYMLVLTNLIMPLFSDDISRRFMMEQFGGYVEGNEASTLDVIWALLSNPWQLIKEIFTPFGRTMQYLLAYWLPLAFIPAISPTAWMVVAFPLLTALMRQDYWALSVNMRFAINVVPGIFYGAIIWWSQHPNPDVGAKHLGDNSSIKPKSYNPNALPSGSLKTHPSLSQEEPGERKKEWGNELADAETRGRGDAENGNPTQNFVHPEEPTPNPSQEGNRSKGEISGNEQEGFKSRFALKPQFRRFWIFCLSLSLVFTFTSNPHRAWSFLFPTSIDPLVYISVPRQWQHAGQIRSLLEQIPPTASVSATTHIVPHLSNRREILGFPSLRLINDARQEISVDYAIADLWQFQQYEVAFDDDRERLRKLVPAIEQILVQGNYGIIDFQDGVMLLKQGATPNSTALSSWQDFREEIEQI